MKEYIPVLKGTRLFAGVKVEELLSMLSCLGARLCTFRKGEFVLRQGERLSEIAVLTAGRLHIQRDDYWGNRSILGELNPGDVFGEAYLAPESGAILNDVVAVEDSSAIFFPVDRITSTCATACPFHTVVVRNLFFVISEKNRNLVQKLRHMSRRTTREKLISYLSEEAKKHSSASFSIPFNRQQLADFLSVDRSAMSNELCRMRDEGLLKFDKNRFELM